MVQGRGFCLVTNDGNASVSWTQTVQELAHATGLSADQVIAGLHGIRNTTREQPVTLGVVYEVAGVELVDAAVERGLLAREGGGGRPRMPVEAVVQTDGFRAVMRAVEASGRPTKNPTWWE